jgi:hypothetical protein
MWTCEVHGWPDSVIIIEERQVYRWVRDDLLVGRFDVDWWEFSYYVDVCVPESNYHPLEGTTHG